MFRRVLLPGSPLVAAVAVTTAPKEEEKSKKLICRPSELPLYNPLNTSDEKKCVAHKQNQGPSSQVAQSIEEGIRLVREQTSDIVGSVTSQKDKIDDFIKDGIHQTRFFVDYLKEEDNTVPRVGAIAMAGLAGMIFGIRGGIIKKFIYASTFAGGVASLCYPEQAKIYSEHGLVEFRKYATIGYNFAYGIKPHDERQLELPKIPTTLAELKEDTSNLVKSAYDAVFSGSK